MSTQSSRLDREYCGIFDSVVTAVYYSWWKRGHWIKGGDGVSHPLSLPSPPWRLWSPWGIGCQWLYVYSGKYRFVTASSTDSRLVLAPNWLGDPWSLSESMWSVFPLCAHNAAGPTSLRWSLSWLGVIILHGARALLSWKRVTFHCFPVSFFLSVAKIIFLLLFFTLIEIFGS